MRGIEILRLGGALDEVERRTRDVARGIETIRVSSASAFNSCDRMLATISWNSSHVGVRRIGLSRLTCLMVAAGESAMMRSATARRKTARTYST